jgi:lactate permease
MEFVLASLPIVVLIVTVTFLKKSVVFSALSAILALMFVNFWWEIPAWRLVSASLKGGFIATEIIIIIMSALLIVEVLRRSGRLEPLTDVIRSLSIDYRIQTLLLAFGLVYFIEGAAGFGTPAIVVVPILIALGFKPLHSVILSLIGDSIPVVFGAVGLPITYGVQSVIAGMTDQSAVITEQVIATTAALNIIGTTLLAVLLIIIATRLKGDPLRSVKEVALFGVISGLIVGLGAYVTAVTIGPELPSLVGGLVGMIWMGTAAHKGWLMPKKPRTISSSVEQTASKKTSPTVLRHALAPYLLLISLLVLSRLPQLPFREWLQQFALTIESIAGYAVDYSYQPLFAAASILVFTAAITLLVSKLNRSEQSAAISTVLGKVKRPYLALLLVLAFVQMLTYSGENLSGLDSLLVVIGSSIADVSGWVWPLFAPMVGALGSFIAGSATVSNLIFSGLQFDIATNLQLQQSSVLALQSVGASLGNMIALHNIVAALAIAGIHEAQAHKVIKANIMPLVILVVVIGAIGLSITS